MAMLTVTAVTMTVMIVTETVVETVAEIVPVIAWETVPVIAVVIASAWETAMETVTVVSATGMPEAAAVAARSTDASETARMNLDMMTLAQGEGTKPLLSSRVLPLFITPGLPVCITDLPSSLMPFFSARVIR